MTENPELDSQSKVGTIIGLSVGLATLSTVIVSCRIYTRAILLKATGIDDAAIIVAQVRHISSCLKRGRKKACWSIIDQL